MLRECKNWKVAPFDPLWDEKRGVWTVHDNMLCNATTRMMPGSGYFVSDLHRTGVSVEAVNNFNTSIKKDSTVLVGFDPTNLQYNVLAHRVGQEDTVYYEINTEASGGGTVLLNGNSIGSITRLSSYDPPFRAFNNTAANTSAAGGSGTVFSDGFLQTSGNLVAVTGGIATLIVYGIKVTKVYNTLAYERGNTLLTTSSGVFNL